MAISDKEAALSIFKKWRMHMYWIGNQRRFQSRSLVQDSKSSTSKNRESGFIGKLFGVVGGFVLTVLAAAIGTAFSSMIAINYLEKYKAEEAIRNMALLQLYQPYKEKINQCHGKMTETIKNAGIIEGINGLAVNYLAISAASPGEMRKISGNSEVVALLSGMLEPYSKASGNMGQSRIDVMACERAIEYAGHELATVLKLNVQYQDLIAKYQKLKVQPVKSGNDSNLVFHFLTNPKLTQSIIQGFRDSEEGNPTRGDAAFAKVRSELIKSHKTSSAELDYFYGELRRSQAFDKEVTELFLRELRSRFEKLPEFAPRKVLIDFIQ